MKAPLTLLVCRQLVMSAPPVWDDWQISVPSHPSEEHRTEGNVIFIKKKYQYWYRKYRPVFTYLFGIGSIPNLAVGHSCLDMSSFWTYRMSGWNFTNEKFPGFCFIRTYIEFWEELHSQTSHISLTQFGSLTIQLLCQIQTHRQYLCVLLPCQEYKQTRHLMQFHSFLSTLTPQHKQSE